MLSKAVDIRIGSDNNKQGVAELSEIIKMQLFIDFALPTGLHDTITRNLFNPAVKDVDKSYIDIKTNTGDKEDGGLKITLLRPYNHETVLVILSRVYSGEILMTYTDTLMYLKDEGLFVSHVNQVLDNLVNAVYLCLCASLELKPNQHKDIHMVVSTNFDEIFDTASNEISVPDTDKAVMESMDKICPGFICEEILDVPEEPADIATYVCDLITDIDNNHANVIVLSMNFNVVEDIVGYTFIMSQSTNNNDIISTNMILPDGGERHMDIDRFDVVEFWRYIEGTILRLHRINSYCCLPGESSYFRICKLRRKEYV